MVALTGCAPQAPIRVASLGDSWGGGAGSDSGNRDDSFITKALEQVGADSLMLTEGGTGYTIGSVWGPPFDERIQPLAEYSPQIVIVEGGINDSMAEPGVLAAAAHKLYADIHEAAPEAQIIVLGPFPSVNSDPELMGLTRDVLKQAVEEDGWVFIDPMADKWLPLEDRYFAEGWHPNQAGHDILARRLADALGPYLGSGRG